MVKTLLQYLFRRFVRDEDGVALAFGITFFLLVFLLGMSVYAVGETVRQRMELQNAADAAAYSGAVVQADTLSRIACINQAMSWTYVMLNRRIMDYATDKFLEKVEQKWDADLRSVRESWNWLSTCGTRIEGTDYRVGFTGHKQIFLNHTQSVMIDEIKAQRKAASAMQKSYHALRSDIDKDRKTLAAMRRAEENLLSALPKRIENAVKNAVRENISETPNDKAAGGAQISHVLIQNNPDTYMETMRNQADQEKIFLVFGGFRPDVKEISQRGVDRWWVRGSGGEGFQREYRQSAFGLSAEWNWNGTMWELTPDACVPMFKAGFTMVNGSEVQDGYFSCRESAKPYRLKEDFFNGKGTILVGVRRKLNNPFSFMFAGGAVKGLFSAFTVRDKRSMWAASAARAAFSPPGKSKQEGAYEATFLSVPAGDSWNLCEADWDAVFLPVAAAFDTGKDRTFRKSSQSALNTIYGKLSPGSISAPPGMDGGEFNFNRAREILKH